MHIIQPQKHVIGKIRIQRRTPEQQCGMTILITGVFLKSYEGMKESGRGTGNNAGNIKYDSP